MVRLRQARELGQHFARHGRLDQRPTGGNLADGFGQLVARDILEQVAERTGAQPIEHVRVVIEGRQDDHPRLGPALAQAARGLHTIQAGHPNVHQHDSRAGRFVLLEGGLTILSLGGDRQVALQLQQRAQAFAHQALVIDDQDTDGCHGLVFLNREKHGL